MFLKAIHLSKPEIVACRARATGLNSRRVLFAVCCLVVSQRSSHGQKLLFFTLIVCLICLLLSGIVIWRVYFSAFFPIGVIRTAALLHAFFAFVLIFAIIVHIYAGIWVKGSIRAMTRGWVTPGWAWKHHRAWFREVGKGVQSK
jgi:formate dehydrogenase gamma subunit